MLAEIVFRNIAYWNVSSLIAEALRTMRELGWIRTERRRLTVLDLDQLQARTH